MKYFFTLVIFNLILAGCSSPYVVRLEPETEVSALRYGEKLITRTEGAAKVTVSYYDSSPKYIVFHLEVENTGDEPFDFDPATCLLIGDAGPVQQAIDPEIQLLSMDIESVKNTREAEGFAIAGIAMTITGAAFAATSGLTDGYFYSDAVINTATDLSFVLQDNNADDAIARGEIAPLDGEEPPPVSRYFWLDHAMRVTTIAPGKSAFGKVAFLRNDAAQNLSFQVSVRGNEFNFPFSQQLFRP